MAVGDASRRRRDAPWSARRLLLVANANASGVQRDPRLVRNAAHALRDTGAQVEVRVTGTREELEEALSAAEERVVLLGGDGSLHAAANASIAPREIALLPAGGANNVGWSLRLPHDLRHAARIAAEGAARPFDLICARTADRTYLAVEGVSVGFDAMARAHYRAANSTDTIAGLGAGIHALAHFHPLHVEVDLDGEATTMRVVQLFVANTPRFGHSLLVAPDADPRDGVLDFVAFDDAPRATLLGLVPHVRRGTHIGREHVRHATAHRIRIRSTGSSPVIADTTNLGAVTVDLSVRRGALAVVGA
jgi:diacylglycerol kinase (ATP)